MPGTVFLDGETVTLRTIEEEDLEFLRDGVNHPDVRVDVGNHRPQNLADEREFFEEAVCGDGPVQLLICRDEEPLGVVGLEPRESDAERIGRLGIWLHPEFHGQGYGTEAMELFVTYAFDQLNYHKLYARTHADNEASRRLFEKLGFEQEGVFRDHAYLDGSYTDLIYHAMFEEEWGH
ncbi:MAG: GNAT family protein [Candidatus Nanohaloarchaea archaeon]|nr:GNAT family protein [Candidatus Nanohaloarchaea archaeon]